MAKTLNMGSHAKLTLFLLLLIFSLHLSAGGVAGFTWAGTNLRDPPSEIVSVVKMRRLMEMAFALDYDKDPGPNRRHEPPKGGGYQYHIVNAGKGLKNATN